MPQLKLPPRRFMPYIAAAAFVCCGLISIAWQQTHQKTTPKSETSVSGSASPQNGVLTQTPSGTKNSAATPNTSSTNKTPGSSSSATTNSSPGTTTGGSTGTTNPTGSSTNTSSGSTSGSTSSSSSKIYWGSWIDGDTYSVGSADAPWSASTAGGSWDLFEQHTAKKVSIIHYGQPAMWNQAFAASPANLITGRGAIPLMDMSSDSVALTSITAGNYDASITTWAQAVKAWSKPFFFRWNWEMNGTWYSWGSQAKANPANFINAWRHMHDIVAAQGANNVTWVWCPNNVFSGSTALSSLYPGDAYVDWTCMDGYNKGTNPLQPNVWESFTSVFQQTYNQILAIAPNKPLMIGEVASTEYGGSKSAWITDALSTQLPQNFPKIKAVNWFNWPIVEGSGRMDWPIESSGTAQTAFKNGIASSYYATNSYGSLTPLSKVQPL